MVSEIISQVMLQTRSSPSFSILSQIFVFLNIFELKLVGNPMDKATQDHAIYSYSIVIVGPRATYHY